MKFIDRIVVAQVTPESLGIKTREQFWKRLVFLQGYNMALITPRELRADYARALIAVAKNLGEFPLPAWQQCIDDPDFYDEWHRKIKSGEYDDEIEENYAKNAKMSPEALSSFGM